MPDTFEIIEGKMRYILKKKNLLSQGITATVSTLTIGCEHWGMRLTS